VPSIGLRNYTNLSRSRHRDTARQHTGEGPSKAIRASVASESRRLRSYLIRCVGVSKRCVGGAIGYRLGLCVFVFRARSAAAWGPKARSDTKSCLLPHYLKVTNDIAPSPSTLRTAHMNSFRLLPAVAYSALASLLALPAPAVAWNNDDAPRTVATIGGRRRGGHTRWRGLGESWASWSAVQSRRISCSGRRRLGAPRAPTKGILCAAIGWRVGAWVLRVPGFAAAVGMHRLLIPWILQVVMAGAASAADPCGVLILLRSPLWPMASPHDDVAEVFLRQAPDAEFELRGLLFLGDWGVYPTCAQTVQIRVRRVTNGASLTRWRRWDDPDVLEINRVDSRALYIAMDVRNYRIVDVDDGARHILRIEGDARLRQFAARWDLSHDRYCLICPSCGRLRTAEWKGTKEHCAHPR
jgi:hypothetical protein